MLTSALARRTQPLRGPGVKVWYSHFLAFTQLGFFFTNWGPLFSCLSWLPTHALRAWILWQKGLLPLLSRFCQSMTRPIIFVAHGLSGIVVKSVSACVSSFSRL